MNDAAGSAAVLGHPLIRDLLSLELAPEDFVIFGSAPMLAHGLRQTIRDLDVVARGAAWQRARELGSPIRGPISGDNMVALSGGLIEVSQGWIAGSPDPHTLISGAEIIRGLRFGRLADILAYKQALGRPKDLPDIDAIIEWQTGVSVCSGPGSSGAAGPLPAGR